MAKIMWSEKPRFESGLSRVVLYPTESSAIPWMGVIQVLRDTDSSSQRYSLDGYKYREEEELDVFKGETQSFSDPPLISASGMTYRTEIGLQGHYRLYLLYNIQLQEKGYQYTTINDSPNVTIKTYDLFTKTERPGRIRPTSYVYFDSDKIDPEYFSIIEDILYGTDESDPRLPTIPEIGEIFGLWNYGYGHGPYGHREYGKGRIG